MVAMMILLMVSLALMQTALLSINANMRNALRDEAVSIAESAMDEARNTPIASLASAGPDDVQRGIRRQENFTYSLTRTVTDLGGAARRVDVTVSWEWQGENFNHSISTVVAQ